MKGVSGSMSFSYSLPVAIIWSARPGDVWSDRKTCFVEGSTVWTVRVAPKKTLNLGGEHTTLREVVKKLSPMPDGEIRKILLYMHNRELGKAKGGEFIYKMFDEDGEELGDDEVPFSLRSPHTRLTWHGLEELDSGYGIPSLAADTFIFADAPAVRRAAKALGYDSIKYMDAFQGGESAAEELLGEDVWDLEGVGLDEDLEGDEIPIHETFRVLDPDIIVSVESEPTAEVLARKL